MEITYRLKKIEPQKYEVREIDAAIRRRVLELNPVADDKQIRKFAYGR